MRYRQEILKGRGQLVSRSSGNQYEVAYRFDIKTRFLELPGKAPVEQQFEVRGSVKAVEGQTLRNEHYDLYTDAATYHVWRDEERWRIDSTLPLPIVAGK